MSTVTLILNFILVSFPESSSKKQKRVIIAFLNPVSDALMHILLHGPAYTSSRWLQGLLRLPKQTMRQLSFTTSNLVQNIWSLTSCKCCSQHQTLFACVCVCGGSGQETSLTEPFVWFHTINVMEMLQHWSSSLLFNLFGMVSTHLFTSIMELLCTE